jgi:hypothetical protein
MSEGRNNAANLPPDAQRLFPAWWGGLIAASNSLIAKEKPRYKGAAGAKSVQQLSLCDPFLSPKTK